MQKTLLAVACAALVAGCGGDGNDVSTSGTYEAYTTDGRHFPISVNFATLTYSYTAGSTTPTTGALGSLGGESFSLRTAPAGSGTTTTSVGSFKLAENLLLGHLPINGKPVPFVAARSFVTNLADISGGRLETLTLNTTRATGISAAPTTWGVYKVNAAASTLSYCKGQPTDVIAGAEPLSDPAACPAGTVAASFALVASATPGLFTQSVVGASGADDNPAEVRFAKVGSNIYYLSAPVSASTTNAAFTIGVSGLRGDLVGTFIEGASSLGAMVEMLFGPAVNTVTFNGGTLATPGSSAGTGIVAAVPSSTNALRYTPSTGTVATAGVLVTPQLAVLGNFSVNGDLSLFAAR